jgi:hypothetical protein
MVPISVYTNKGVYRNGAFIELPYLYEIPSTHAGK